MSASAAEPSPIVQLLQEGQMAITGKFVWGSNYTFLVTVEHEGSSTQAVYKPTRGERPLWDFPTASLAHREVAAYWVSQALGWQLVPETVYRRQGPAGAGSLQRYIEHDPEYHYFNFSEEDRQRLRPVVLFDLVINNADRKGSHLLVDENRHIWLIDHGICFHVEDKLRTVIWDFVGEPIPPNLLDDLCLLQENLTPAGEYFPLLRQHLASGEIKAMSARISTLLETARYPDLDPDQRPYPWPPL